MTPEPSRRSGKGLLLLIFIIDISLYYCLARVLALLDHRTNQMHLRDFLLLEVSDLRAEERPERVANADA